MVVLSRVFLTIFGGPRGITVIVAGAAGLLLSFAILSYTPEVALKRK